MAHDERAPLTKLMPDMGDMDIDGALEHLALPAPHIIQYLAAAEDASPMGSQQGNDAEVLGCQPYLAAVSESTQKGTFV